MVSLPLLGLEHVKNSVLGAICISSRTLYEFNIQPDVAFSLW